MRKNVGKKKLLLTVLSALTLSLAATIGAFADENIGVQGVQTR